MHGGSFGGGQALTLATLRDKVRLPDGSLVTWRSPMRRLPMQMAAAAPLAPWSDLAYSFMPNGRTLDYVRTGPFDDFSPPGVAKAGWVHLLQTMGNVNGWFPPPGADPSSDMQTWYGLIQAGEPYGAELSAGLGMMAAFKSAYYIDTGADPAPTLVVSGYTDELFPVDEAVRWANKYPDAPIAQLYMDYGHQRAQNKQVDLTWMRTRVDEWFAYYLKGDVTATPPLTGVETFTQTCPFEVRSGGPYRAPSFDAVSPGEIRYTGAGPKRAVSDPVDPVGPEIDSLRGGTACITTSSVAQAGVATFRGPSAIGSRLHVARLPDRDRRSRDLAGRPRPRHPAGSATVRRGSHDRPPDPGGARRVPAHPQRARRVPAAPKRLVLRAGARAQDGAAGPRRHVRAGIQPEVHDRRLQRRGAAAHREPAGRPVLRRRRPRSCPSGSAISDRKRK